MIFPEPQWRWRTCHEALRFGFVDNVVRICPARGKERSAFVSVPTEFFQFAAVIFGGEAKLAHATITGADFYLDETSDGWIFGIETLDAVQSVDLWLHRKLPVWASLALERRN